MSLINSYFKQVESSSILVVFRICFGFLMFISLLRFWFKGWIDELYLQPMLHFHYYGFEWVEVLGDYTYFLFLICIISSLFICIGFKYQVSIISFFLSFSYIELMDKTMYLNHYYFISILSFLLIFLPANTSFSIDNLINGKSYKKIPKWTIDSIKLLISIVYIYAALSKLNSDWLFEAVPLKIWLTSKYDLPILGSFLTKEWVHYLMSWGGMLYDLIIPFLLLYHRTRVFGFLLVIVFHLLTKILFPIGMFPYIMIFVTLIFFSSSFHDKVLDYIYKIIRYFFFHRVINTKVEIIELFKYRFQKIVLGIIVLFFFLQIFIPFRYIFYPGELLWHEQGYRFSWRVMLVEKIGIANFKIVNTKDDSFFYVNNCDFLTPFQEKQMSFQPDMILEYAHFLGDFYSTDRNNEVEVFVDNYVSLNGRKSRMLVSDTVNLYKEKQSLKNKKWIISLQDEIQGF